MEKKSVGAVANSSTISLPIGTGTRISALNPESINILRICETARSHNFRANRREKPAADASFSNYRRRFRGAQRN